MKINHQKGYTLLFAIVVSTIVLSIAAFVLQISRKQFILASAARDSTVAIYAADSGIECAVEAYSNSAFNAPTPASSMTCNGVTVTPVFVSLSSSPTGMNFDTSDLVTRPIYQTAPMVFGIHKDSNNVFQSCILVTVTVGYETDLSHKVIIDSKGYNAACSGNTPVAGPRTEERAIRLVYHD